MLALLCCGVAFAGQHVFQPSHTVPHSAPTTHSPAHCTWLPTLIPPAPPCTAPLGSDPNFRTTALEFQAKVHGVAVKILKSLFRGLGWDESRIDEVRQPAAHQCRGSAALQGGSWRRSARMQVALRGYGHCAGIAGCSEMRSDRGRPWAPAGTCRTCSPD